MKVLRCLCRILQAVIGAGAGGLVAARELLREGHRVTVYEKGSAVGGVWLYTDEVEYDDPLGEMRPAAFLCDSTVKQTVHPATSRACCASHLLGMRY